MDGVAGQRGWRWIMILEGLPTFVLGIACWFWLADDPETAYYLSAEEKELMLRRRARQGGHVDHFDWADCRKGLKDWKIYAFSFGQFGGDTMLYGFSTFLPTIIKGLNPRWSSALVQVLTIPVYATGAIAYITIAILSDRTQRRGPFACAMGLISIIGYAMLMSKSSSGVHYAGCFFVACGLYVLVGIPLAWLPNNNPRYGKRTTATGLQLTIGNTSGIMAGFLYPSKEGPRFLRGHGVTLGLVAWSVCVYAFMSWYFTQENRKRRNGQRDEKIAGLNEDEITALGDESPRYMFTT